MINVLIVSENSFSRATLKAYLLTYKKIEVVEAANIKEQIAKCKEFRFDVIIIDIYSNVSTWVNRLNKQTLVRQHGKILAFIPSNFTYGVKMLMNMGALGYISKDCTEKDFRVAISNVSKGKQFFSKELAASYFATQLKDNLEGKDLLHLQLSKREIEIITLIIEGLDNNGVADQLGISRRTVEVHKRNIYKKTAVNNNAALIHFANYQLGFLKS